MVNIHPSAVVDKKAEIADSVEIGPFCTVGPKVKLADGVKLISHVTVENETTIGDGTIVHPFAVVGGNAQHKAHMHDGDSGVLIIGKNNTIREHTSIHIGTPVDKSKTVIGDNCLFMHGVHIAHDCDIGNDVIVSSTAAIAGHVKIDDFAIIGGLAGIHQFCRVGKLGMLGGMSSITHDIIPYGLYIGSYGTGYLRGLNLVGLKRKGVSKEEISELMNAYNLLFNKDEGVFSDRVDRVEQEFSHNIYAKEIIDFIKEDTERPLAMPFSTSIG